MLSTSLLNKSISLITFIASVYIYSYIKYTAVLYAMLLSRCVNPYTNQYRTK